MQRMSRATLLCSFLFRITMHSEKQNFGWFSKATAMVALSSFKNLFIMLDKVVLTSKSVREILECDHSNESYWAVLSCYAVNFALQGDSNFEVCQWNP